MLEKYEAVCYELLRPEQVRKIQETAAIVYIPVGSLEYHSFHNPLGTDSIKAHAICCEAALKYGGIVLPAFHYGIHGCVPQSIANYTIGFGTAATIEAVVFAAVQGLTLNGWKIFVGVTGHDLMEQRDAIGLAIKRGTIDSFGADGFAVMDTDGHMPGDDIPFGGDHAGAWETSCMLYAAPGKVRLASAREAGVPDDEEEFSYYDWYRFGICGTNPVIHASAERGKKIVESVADRIGQRAKTMLKKIPENGYKPYSMR